MDSIKFLLKFRQLRHFDTTQLHYTTTYQYQYHDLSQNHLILVVTRYQLMLFVLFENQVGYLQSLVLGQFLLKTNNQFILLIHIMLIIIIIATPSFVFLFLQKIFCTKFFKKSVAPLNACVTLKSKKVIKIKQYLQNMIKVRTFLVVQQNV